MADELIMFEGKQALAELKRNDYIITSPITNTQVTLKRDVDFGVIPKTKTPSLYKAGAEKVILAYGLLQHYTIESKIENVNGKDAFFMYTIRCDLVKIANDGKEYVFSSGIGSANTGEKRNGFNSPFDAANSSLKMAQKRAMVAAAINIGGLSSMFSQDLEDEKFMAGYNEIANTQKPTDKVTAKQVKRLFALAAEIGLNANEAKQKLAAAGYTKTTELTQADYEKACDLFKS